MEESNTTAEPRSYTVQIVNNSRPAVPLKFLVLNLGEMQVV